MAELEELDEVDAFNQGAQIKVSKSLVAHQLGSLLRVMLGALSGYLVGKGWMDASVGLELVPVILMVVSLVWSAWNNRKTRDLKVEIANRVPNDSVVVVK